MLRLLLASLLLAPVALAQTPQIVDAPVRYDTDLLSPAFHESRRALVLDALPDDGVALFFSTPMRVRENDVDFEHRQDSYLYYLTGTHEPTSVLLLAKGGVPHDSLGNPTALLLNPPRNPFSEVWEGRRFGAARASATLGLPAVDNTQLEDLLDALVADGRRFYHLPLPEGVEDDPVGEQIAAFTSRVPLLTVDGNGFVVQAAQAMLTLDDPAVFPRAQQVLGGRMSADDFEQDVMKRAYAGFVASNTLAEWDAWRQANLGAYANGSLLPSVIDPMRMVKTDEEMVLMRKAVDISVAAHNEVIRSIEPGMYEYQAEALAEYLFARGGAQSPGYPSIVGSGENSTILHYNTNRRQMQSGDLVVMDMGAEYHGYTADITRTVPVNGRFSPEQRAIYDLVLRAQEAGIEASVEGAPFSAPGQAATQVITQGLRDLGLIQTQEDVRRFFMHGTSHYLGLWVHDVGDRTLPAGAVITVEPGIYISPDVAVDPKWWNIGVRIEDDILITPNGPVNLSAASPRTADALEALMTERGLGNQSAGN